MVHRVKGAPEQCARGDGVAPERHVAFCDARSAGRGDGLEPHRLLYFTRIYILIINVFKQSIRPLNIRLRLLQYILAIQAMGLQGVHISLNRKYAQACLTDIGEVAHSARVVSIGHGPRVRVCRRRQQPCSRQLCDDPGLDLWALGDQEPV